MQGDWAATAMEKDEKPVSGAGATSYLAGIRLTVRGDEMTLDLSRIKGPVYVHKLKLHPVVTPKVYSTSDLVIDGKRVPGPNAGVNGLYEVDENRFRLLLPTTKPAPVKDLPKALKTVPGTGLMLITFERAKPDVTDWLDRLLPARAARRLFPSVAGPYTVGGWAYTLNRDLSVTADLPAAKTRFVYHPDRSVTVTGPTGTSATLPPPTK